ncbi:MAG: rRNA maturation RNase YbeY [Acidimicrobiia bacterium]|nr:rRNA maturation RNase YbeY [Acidimicrobiia bacterium]
MTRRPANAARPRRADADVHVHGGARADGRLHVAVVDARGRPRPASGLDRWLSALAGRRVCGAVTVALVSDARVRALNRRFRHVHGTTDVLSFPTSSQEGLAPSSSGAGRYLGDIVIAEGVARRQAQQLGHSWATEERILALHGLLHLIGYDHDSPSDDGAMARIERTWRRRGGLPNGLIDRVDAHAPTRAVAHTARGARPLTRRRRGPTDRVAKRRKTGGGPPEQ